MTQKDFRRQIELHVDRYKDNALCASTYSERVRYRGDIILIQEVISRTVRLCCQYPELAQEYLDNLSKATMD